MRNVLFGISLAVGLCVVAPAISQPAPFCPDGWSCGKPEGHSNEMGRTKDGGDICLIIHTLKTDDGIWQTVTTLYTIDVEQDAHVGFGLILMKKAPSGAAYEAVPLRSFRILSANRKLDTREWKIRRGGAGLHSVQIALTPETKPAAVAAIGIATGAAYGVLAETQEGKRVRIEARQIARMPTVIRDFQACVENRDMPTIK